jgi:tRNA U34 5-methylaminomethyl-2-thiouridine-forming methyltransferase MnmC
MYAEVEEIVTGDGSATLYDKALDVTYRSRFGAISESQYVFIEGTRLPEIITSHVTKGLSPDKPIKILELGFGAATNFYSTVTLYASLAGKARNIPIEYLGIDYRPLHPDILPNSSQFTPLVRDTLLGLERHPIHSVTHPDFPITLTLLRYPWNHPEAVDYTEGYDADCYFHDPFGPRTNPESWDELAFRWAYDRIKSKGILATYSAASQVKRHIRAVGFSLEVRKGLPPKREVVAAVKP